jgi:DNA-binding response OmpR family regulator
MKTILITADLMTASQVAAAAGDAGVELLTAESAAQAVSMASENDLACVILDLSTPALDVANVVVQMKEQQPPARVIAFGPHVHVEKLKAARTAGCDEVLTRGQFYEQMRQVLQSGIG